MHSVYITLCFLSQTFHSHFPQVNSTLKQLDLSWNAFGQMEAESLGQALKNNRTLVLLDLSGNHVDDQAVTLLCQGLITNDTLGTLKVSRWILDQRYLLCSISRHSNC